MCHYIKDDGEQCGRTAAPFCHDHENTAFATLWRRDDDSAGIVMDASCDDCNASLRRTERFTTDEMRPQGLVEAVVKCDCCEVVLGTQPLGSDAPSGWP